MSNYFFDANLGPQVLGFLEDVDDLISNKSASPVEKLMELINCEEKAVRENAITMLAYSTQSPNNKDVAREVGLIKLFIKLSQPSQLSVSTNAVKNSVMGIMFLANQADANKQSIGDEGGIDIIFELINDLVLHIKSPKEGVKLEDIVNTLSQSLNLIIILSTLAPLREKLGSIKNFLVINSLLVFDFPQQIDIQYQIQERSLSALNNICMLKENKDNAKVAGCIDNVLQLFSSKKNTIQESALRWIYNMTIIDSAREHIRKSKGIESYLGYIKEHSKETQLVLFALKGFSNMAVDRQTIEHILLQSQTDENFMKPVLDLLDQSTDLTLLDQVLSLTQNLVSEDNLLDQVPKLGIVAKLVSAAKGMPLTNTTQQSILLKTTCIISALITLEEQQQSSVENGVLALLVDFLKLQSADIRREAAKALANATPYFDDVRGEIGRQGGVKACLDMLLSSDKELVKQAARALVNLARNTQNEEDIYESKGLEHSIRLINSPEKDLKMLGTKLLVNLSLNEKARISFCQKGGLSIVASLLTSSDIELQLQGTKIVTNVAISGRNRKLMNESVPELIPAIQKLMNLSTTGPFVNETKAQADVAFNNLTFPYESNYDGLDFGLEDHIQLTVQSQYERDDDDSDDEEGIDEKEKQRRLEEEELRFMAEREIEERKRIMEEEMKRIEERRRKDQEKREQEEREAREKKEEAEKQRKLAEEMEKLRIEEETKKRVEEEKKAKEEKERLEALEVERIKQLTQQQKLKEEQERKEREEKERQRLEVEKRQKEEEAERQRKLKEEQERKAKEEQEEKERLRVEREEKERVEREEEEKRMRAIEEEKLEKMKLEIKQREIEMQRKKEEEETRRKKEEHEKKLQEQQDKASQESARLAQEASKAQKRTHIVQEIMQVEVNYVKNLNMVVRKFLHPLSSAASSKRPIITNDKINAIFSTVDNINNHNSIFCDGLTSRIKRWFADNKKDPLMIGDIFAKIGTFMNDYSQYINNYNNAIKTYNECRKTNLQFAQFVKKVEADPELNDRELENLLITPVQQFPRYIMLIQDLIRNTNEDHPDYKALTEALEKIKHSTSYINEKKREAEDAFAMLSINQSLHGKVPNHFLAPHRKFIKEGAILFGSSSGSFKDKDPVVFLFNDMVMMTVKHPTKPNEYKYRYSVMLGPTTTVEDLASVNNGFMIKSAQQWWSFSSPTANDKSVWVDSINKALKSLPKEALKSSIQNSNSTSKRSLF